MIIFKKKRDYNVYKYKYMYVYIYTIKYIVSII